MMRLAIRVSSASSSGRGHFERCLAIRSYIPEGVFWFVDYESDYIKNKIFKSDKIFYENGKNKFNILKNNLEKYSINCILIDSYAINSKDIHNISNNIPIVVFDDQNTNTIADILICPHPLNYNDIQGKKYLIGPKYAPISNKFSFFEKENSKDKKILISFGAYDSNGITLNVIKSVKKFIEDSKYNLNIIIVLGKESPIITQVQHEIRNLSNYKLILDCDKMEKIYKNCDIAIGSPGLSYLERMASGTPSILISQNKLHDILINKWVDLGCGIKAENSANSIEYTLKKLILDDNLHQELILKGKNTVDGKGAERIAKEIINMVSIK